MRKKTIRAHITGHKRAASHAATHLHIGVLTKTPGMLDWRGANLGRPVTVYDLNDEPLFYDFPVLSRGRQRLGLIRASASRVIGVPVPSIHLGPAVLDVDEASRKAARLVRRKYKRKVVGTKLVCYAYPKLGIAVLWEKRGEPQRTIVDVGDFSIVPEKVKPEMRGPGAVSSYGRIQEGAVPRAVRNFGRYGKVVDELQERSGKDLSTRLNLREFDALQVVLEKAVVQLELFYTRVLTFCTHGFSHECFRLHGQETGVWCVPATGQMILDFWRYHRSQTAIAAAMGTGAGGTGYAGEVNGYESIACDHFDAQSDFSPTIAEARAEIVANRPFDYSYSYHAMACAGYRRARFQIAGVPPQYSLLLYDPSPVNTGTIRWETWGAGISPVDGFVYLRRP